MRVVITCEKCSAVVEVHMAGGWDIKGIKHDCTVKPGMRPEEYPEARARPNPIRVEFDPPRSVF